MKVFKKWERKELRGERKQEKGVSGGKNRWEEAHRVMDKKGRNRKGERDHGEKRGHLFPIYTVCYMEWEEQGVGLITAQSPEKKKEKRRTISLLHLALRKGTEPGREKYLYFSLTPS